MNIVKTNNAEFNKNKYRRILIIILALIAVIIALIVCYFKIITPAISYNKAVELLSEQKFEKSISLFKQLKDYKDSADMIKECHYQKGLYEFENKNYGIAVSEFEDVEDYKDSQDYIVECRYKRKLYTISNTKRGNIIEFGRFYSKNEDELEPLLWVVLEKIDNTVLVMSRDVIATSSYDYMGYSDTKWENCFIREWLNNDFIDIAFDDKEKENLHTTTVVNKDNPYYDTDGGRNTEDKVFLLSFDEYNEYVDQQIGKWEWAFPNDYAKSAYENIVKKPVSWWLRTPGYTENRVMKIVDYGEIDSYGSDKELISGVRPAMWIKCE